jgi:hypothetical protein
MYIQFGIGLIGTIYLVFGIVGFVPVDAINPFHAEGVGARYLLNLVAVNPLHNVVHLALGLSALAAARTSLWSRRWGKMCGAVLLTLFVAGMIQAAVEGFPYDQMFLRLLPLNSPGHILHLVSGGIALYLGFAPAVPNAKA